MALVLLVLPLAAAGLVWSARRVQPPYEPDQRLVRWADAVVAAALLGGVGVALALVRWESELGGAVFLAALAASPFPVLGWAVRVGRPTQVWLGVLVVIAAGSAWGYVTVVPPAVRERAEAVFAVAFLSWCATLVACIALAVFARLGPAAHAEAAERQSGRSA